MNVIARPPNAPVLRPALQAAPSPEARLARRLGVPTTALKPDAGGRALEEVARAVVRRQEDILRSLYPSTGYSSPEALAEVVDARRPRVKQLLDEDQLELVMHRPSRSREDIVRTGRLQNLHQTGLTRGANAFDGPAAIRSLTESTYLDLPLEEYQALPAAVKPDYGFARAHPDTGLLEPLVGFGDDAWVFNAQALEGLVTFVPGDSLNQWRDTEGDGVVTSRSRQPEAPASWERVFIPGSHRELFQASVVVNPHGVLTTTDPTATLGVSTTTPFATPYTEWQHWGERIIAKHVKAFEFNVLPPEGDFLQLLQVNGVAIFDGRGGARVAWSPETNAALALGRVRKAISSETGGFQYLGQCSMDRFRIEAQSAMNDPGSAPAVLRFLDQTIARFPGRDGALFKGWRQWLGSWPDILACLEIAGSEPGLHVEHHPEVHRRGGDHHQVEPLAVTEH